MRQVQTAYCKEFDILVVKHKLKPKTSFFPIVSMMSCENCHAWQISNNVDFQTILLHFLHPWRPEGKSGLSLRQIKKPF